MKAEGSLPHTQEPATLPGFKSNLFLNYNQVYCMQTSKILCSQNKLRTTNCMLLKLAAMAQNMKGIIIYIYIFYLFIYLYIQVSKYGLWGGRPDTWKCSYIMTLWSFTHSFFYFIIHNIQKLMESH
jgi:hypothetical protein